MMNSFESCIVAPILSLEADSVTNLGKMDEVPLPTKPAVTTTTFESLDHYVETMQHALLHETLETVSSDYGDREFLGLIRLEVNGYERSRSADRRCVIECEITVETLADVTRQMPQGRKAEFFIQDSTVGIVQVGDGGGKRILALIADKTRKR